MMTLLCQRWRDRRESAVPAGSLIDPSIMRVALIDETKEAKPFIVQHHYSGTFPAARLCVGLFRRADLVGVAVFSVGMQPAAMPKWSGVEAGRGCELGRLVLLDDVAGNAESWFIARAFSALKREKPRLQAVLSYADPVERRDAAGRVVKPGHVGTIYQAMSALYRGRASPRTDYLTPAGEHVSRRAMSKIMLGEIGEGYAVDQLHRLGAPRREGNEIGRDWIDRLRGGGFLRGVRHPGNHTYVFPLTLGGRIAAKKLDTQPYPKIGFMKEGMTR